MAGLSDVGQTLGRNRQVQRVNAALDRLRGRGTGTGGNTGIQRQINRATGVSRSNSDTSNRRNSQIAGAVQGRATAASGRGPRVTRRANGRINLRGRVA